jgi:D-serine deaminase-like pyridoxal phosphate-dependent protein
MNSKAQLNGYPINQAEYIDSPALLIFPALVQANIDALKSLSKNTDNLRPHIKTNKSPEAVKMMIDSEIQKFKCATIAEAEMLATVGVKDILLAYQPTGPKLLRYLALLKQYPDIKWACLVDSIHTAEYINAVAAQYDQQILVYLDINVGMNRTGILPNKASFELFLYCSTLSHLQPIGLHAYDGHIRQKDLVERRVACEKAFALVFALKNSLANLGLGTITIVAGGTPTFPIHAQRDDVECSPGTFIYWDKGYQMSYPEQLFTPAAILLTRVVSVIDAHHFCVDLGHKSVASENELTSRVFFPAMPKITFVSQSEEHLVLHYKNHGMEVGCIMYGIPYHICPTVALYERAAIIEDGQWVGEWHHTARDRKITY